MPAWAVRPRTDPARSARGDRACNPQHLPNHTTSAVDLTLRAEMGPDFADLFEIKNAQCKPAGATAQPGSRPAPRTRGPGSHRLDRHVRQQPRFRLHRWKDSPDAVSYRDGRFPGFPRATCELQGYAYDAKVRADRLERETAELEERFNRDFRVADGGYYALALAADGNQMDALPSDIGHLLWSGIVDADRARSVTDHVLGPAMFTGWGSVRTVDALGRSRPD